MMKRVKVKANQKALILKSDKVVKVVSEGTYYTSMFRKVEKYDVYKQFISKYNNEEIRTNTVLKNELNELKVLDNQVCLVFKDGIFNSVLNTGIYFYWKANKTIEFKLYNTDVLEIDTSIDKNLLENKMLQSYLRSYKIEPEEKAVLYVNGEITKQLDSGKYYFWNNSILLDVVKVDTRQKMLEVSGQEILTKDKVSIRLNLFSQYKVIDIVKALSYNKDFEKQLYVLLQLIIRSYIGNYTLDEILNKKEEIAENVLAKLKEESKDLGIEVNNCGIRDIILPGDIREIMNKVLIAEKKAQANIITRREETASTRSLLNTAKLMEDNKMLYKLKELEYIEKISDKITNLSVGGGAQILDQMKTLFVQG